MKKVFTLVILIVIPSVIFGQATVSFHNNETGLVQQWTSSSDPTLGPVPIDGGYVELIATTAGNPLLHPLGVYEGSSGFLPGFSSLAGFLAANPGWVVPSAGDEFGNIYGPQTPAPIMLAPGRFNGGTLVIPAPTVFPRADADYLVIGWSGPYSTYDAAYEADLANPNSSFLGVSAVATTGTGGGVPNPSPPGLLDLTFQGITLAPAIIPEPTTVLPAGLGAVMLMLLHRRR